jgi:hypothetical protein
LFFHWTVSLTFISSTDGDNEKGVPGLDAPKGMVTWVCANEAEKVKHKITDKMENVMSDLLYDNMIS